jgi:hypothetical protein
MATERKFDIFKIIEDKINKLDIAFFDKLEPYEIRQIYPLIIMKWVSGGKNATQIKLTNDLVNTVCFQLYNHPKLLYKLLMATSTGKSRPVWVKRPSKAKESSTINIIKEFHNCSTEQASDYLKLFSNDDILEMAERLGSDKETVTKLKKELNG